MSNIITLYPEITILAINLCLILFMYYKVYPDFAGQKLRYLLVGDILINIIALGFAYTLYYNSGVEFTYIIGSTNWFFFSIISYYIMETYFFFEYLKKYRIDILNDEI